jgi:hypothetical protein
MTLVLAFLDEGAEGTYLTKIMQVCPRFQINGVKFGIEVNSRGFEKEETKCRLVEAESLGS